MNNRMKNRIAEVQRTIGSRPIPPDLVEERFEEFKKTGELPEDQTLATAVYRRVMRGYAEKFRSDGEPDWGFLVDVARTAPKRQKDKVMDALLVEAIFATGIIQAAAREALVLLARNGVDVTGTPFAGKEWELPEYGGVGTDFRGIPERFAKRPYLAQARRLFARCEKLRPRLPDDRDWFERLGHATDCFRFQGEQPEDPLMLEAVLALGELTAVMRHSVGADVAPEMAVFDRIARSKGDEREAAIAELQQMAADGYFVGDDE